MAVPEEAAAEGPPRTLDELTGRTLGEFIVGQRLGQGGSGVVYRAEQPLLGREAVIKVLLSNSRDNDAATKRFLREARLASKLDHPYAAHVYAFGAETDGLLWIAMEMVRGTPLNRMIQDKGAIPLHRVVALMERLCEVVQTAHEQGMVHRDIKPANVMVLSRAGRLLPKLLDFGIAKLRDVGGEAAVGLEAVETAPGEAAEAPEAAGSPGLFQGDVTTQAEMERVVSMDLTGEGAYLGSPHYMAPEQWRNSSTVDARADVYSLGILCFQALTGKVPFNASNVQQLVRQHARTPVPPLPSSLPEALNTVMARAMAKRPEDRYASASELAVALRAAAALSEDPAQMPQLEPSILEDVVTEAPQPIAETVTLLEAARSARGALEALEKVTRVVCRYLALVALACRARTGPGAAEDAPDVLKALQSLRKASLTDAAWLALARELTRPFADKRELHPVPELVGHFFEHRAEGMVTKSTAWELLLDLLATVTPEMDEGRLVQVLASGLGPLAKGLASIAFLNEYPLVLARDGAGERWMGTRRVRRSASTMTAEVVSGELALLDAEGAPVVLLAPLLQALSPTPGASEEVFFLEGNGRHGAKLVAMPLGFERHDEGTWEWFERNLNVDEAAGPSSAAQEKAPFNGLASFTSDDAENFFGREREAEAFANRMRTQSLLAVVGPSGVGKSSFIQAGVLPLLKPQWRAITARPGPTPLAALLARLAEGGVDITGLREELPRNRQALRSRLLQGAKTEGIVLIVDQFEELLTLCHDADERRLFAEVLAAAAGDVDAPVRVVLTLRDDFLIRVQQISALRERVAQGLQLLATPASEDLERILTEPVRRLGYAFDEASFPKQMADEVAEQPGALALLSFTATKLWELRDRRSRKLTFKSYQSLGGVGGALAHHAEEVLGQLAPEEQKLVRETFRHLVSAEGTRAILTRSELQQVLGGGAPAERVLEQLIGARLLVASEGQGTEDRVEVIHEALLSSWPRLVRWQREDAEGARMRDQLRAAARQWADRGRVRGVLWRGEALMEYRLWRARYPGALTSAEEAFARASLAEDARGRGLRRGLLVASFLVLGVGMGVLYRANGRAERSAQEARDRLAALHEEQGRQTFAAGRPLQALVYLQKAYEEGVRSAGLRYLLARGVEASAAQLASLQGHTKKLYTGRFSPDGAWVVSASADHTVRIWDARQGQLSKTLEGFGDNVYVAAFSPDSRRVVAGSEDGSARIWELDTGKVRVLSLGSPVLAVVFTKDGRGVVTGTRNGQVKVWDSATGALRFNFPGAPGAVGALEVSPGGHRLATAVGWMLAEIEHDTQVRVWDLDTGKLLQVLGGHQRPVVRLAFAPDGERLLTTSLDRTAKVFDLGSGAVLANLKGHSGAVLAGGWNPKHSQVITGSEDGMVRLWDPVSGDLLSTQQGHSGPVRTLTFSRDGTLFASGGEDSQAVLWDAATGKSLMRYVGHTDAVRDVAFSPEGQRLLTASADARLKLWDATRRLQLVQLRNAEITTWGQFSPDGARVFTASGARHLRTWDAGTGALRESFTWPGTEPSFPTWSRDGQRVVVDGAEQGRTAEIWDFVRGERRVQLKGHAAPLNALAWGDHDRLVASASDDKTVGIWEAASGQRLRTLEFPDKVQSVTFSRDGLRLFAGCRTDTLGRVYDPQTGALQLTLQGHTLGIFAADFSPDGRHLVTGGGDQTLRTWNTQTGAPELTLRGHQGMIATVVYSPDGSLILSAASDRVANVWDARSGALLQSLPVQQNAVAANFSPEGARILTTGYEGNLDIWNASLEPRSPAQLAGYLRCHVPYRLEGEQVVAAEPPPSCRGAAP